MRSDETRLGDLLRGALGEAIGEVDEALRMLERSPLSTTRGRWQRVEASVSAARVCLEAARLEIGAPPSR